MHFKNAESLIELTQAYDIISNLGESYPDFRHWYFNKVIPGTMLNQDKVILALNKNEIIGVSIIKDDLVEKKLRALRIKEKYQSKGYGLHLVDESLRQLCTDKPLVTVNEKMINDYSRMFINRYNFDMTYVHKNMYIQNELEYQFNGNIESLKHAYLPF